MTEENRSWRALTSGERAVLGRLLSLDFPGRAELAAQLDSARVSRIDREGSLQFRVVGAPARVLRRVPVNGRFSNSLNDSNFGSAVNLLLHVVDGRLHELEIYTDDGSNILPDPFEIDPNRIEVY